MTNEKKEQIKQMVFQFLNGTPNLSIKYNEPLCLLYINEVEREILDYINHDELPKGLDYIVTKRVIGRLIEFYVIHNDPRNIYGDMGAHHYDGDTYVASVTIGDTSTSYKEKSNEDKIQYLNDFRKNIKELKNYGKDQLNKYRRISWW